MTTKSDAARAAVERLANVQMNLSLGEWGELSGAILAALNSPKALENDKVSLADAHSKDTRLLRERVRELSAALEPFAALADYLALHAPDALDSDEIGGIHAGDLRRARSVLAQGVE